MMNSAEYESRGKILYRVLIVVFAVIHYDAAASDSEHRCNSMSSMDRAGHPQCVARWATPFPNARYRGYYVGGGAAFHSSKATICRGECRYRHEGTFGVDYFSGVSRLQSNWFHGKKQQGGEGQYEPDGHNNPFEDYFGFGPHRD